MGVGSLWAGPYLQNVYGLTKQTAGNIIMMFPLGMVFGCPLSGYISDKIMKSRKKVLLLGCFFHTLSYIPLVFFTHNLSVISLYYLFLWYGLSGGFFVSCFACAKETCAPRFAGTAMGSLNIFIFVGGAFYQQIMGIVIGKFPVVKAGVYSTAAYQAAFAVPLAGLILGMILYSFFREKPIT
jgi:sugar phosphate permease